MNRWRLFCFVTLLLVMNSLSSVFAQQGVPARVTVVEVVERVDLASWRHFTGTVEPRRHSLIGSAVSGRVTKFLVNEGDAVKAGDSLAQLLTRNIEIQIAAATAEWELRQQELLELKNGSRKEEREESAAKLRAAESTMKFAKTRLERTKGLVERNATTKEHIDEDASVSETAMATYLAAKAAHELVVAGPRQERIAQAVARADAAKEEVNRLQDMLEKHTIKAPFAGFVVAEHTEVGQWIESGKLVAEVIEVDPIEIRVSVQESYVSHLVKGMSAHVELDALPGEKFVGKITAIVPKADEKSRTFPVKVTLPNPAQDDGTPLLKPGMGAKVDLRVDQKELAMLVPKDSLVLGGKQPLVYVVATDDENKTIARPIPVTLGIASGSWITVRGDLKPKDLVVVEGNERLRPGAEIVTSPASIKPPKQTEAAAELSPK